MDFRKTHPVKRIDGNCLSDGSKLTSYAFEVEPFPFDSLTADQLESQDYQIAQIFSSLPKDTSLQVIVQKSKKPSDALEIYSEDRGHELLSRLAIERLEAFKHHFQQERVFSKRYYLLFRCPSGEGESSFLDSFQRSAEASGLRLRPLSEKRTYEVLAEYFNSPGFEPHILPHDSLKGFMGSPLERVASGVRLGLNEYRGVVTLDLLPDETWSAMLSEALSLPFEMWSSVQIKIPDQVQELRRLESRFRFLSSFSQGWSGGSTRDIKSEAKRDQTEEILELVLHGGQSIYQLAVTFVVRAESTKQLEARLEILKQSLSRLGNPRAVIETMGSLEFYLAGAPGGTPSQSRLSRASTLNTVHLLPLFGEGEGTPSGRSLFRDSSDGVYSLDSFDSKLENYGQIVLGGSGSGKSFFTNLLLLQQLSSKSRLIVIDNGGSFHRLVHLLGGVVVELGGDKPMCINPFDIGSRAVLPEDVGSLARLVEFMAFSENRDKLSAEGLEKLKNYILALYDQLPASRTLGHLRKSLQLSKDQEMKKVAQCLESWTGSKGYGPYVDGESSLSTSTPFLLFEISKFQGDDHAKQVFLLLLLRFITSMVQDQGARLSEPYETFLVLDEVWALLANAGFGAEIVEQAFRTFRKFNGSPICITQDVGDLVKSKTGRAIMANAATKWILKQGNISEDFSETLKLNPREMDLAKRLRFIKGKLSQVFLLRDQEKRVLNVEPLPLEYWVATTAPEDKAKIPGKDALLSELLALSEELPFGAAFNKEEVPL